MDTYAEMILSTISATIAKMNLGADIPGEVVISPSMQEILAASIKDGKLFDTPVVVDDDVPPFQVRVRRAQRMPPFEEWIFLHAPED